MVVHVQGNAYDLYLHYREYKLLMRRNIARNCLTQLRIPWKYTDSFSTISAHPNNLFYRYRMPLKQILQDKNVIIELNATHWEIKLFFVNIWTADIIYAGFINLVHICFLPFPYVVHEPDPQILAIGTILGE